jgi:hypothetical protein
MVSDLVILAAADRIKLRRVGTVADKLAAAIKLVVADENDAIRLDMDAQLKAAVIATLRVSDGPADENDCAALMSELDILFGATAARTGEPVTLETVLEAFPGGRFPIGVLTIWLNTAGC